MEYKRRSFAALFIILAMVGAALATETVITDESGITSAGGVFNWLVIGGTNRTTIWQNYNQGLNTSESVQFAALTATANITLNGDTRTAWPTGGNPFDQTLNTTSSVEFDDANITDGLTLGGVTNTAWPTGGDTNASATFTYWEDSGTYYALEARTGSLTSNANFGTLINGRIDATLGGDHYLHQGTFQLTSDIGIAIDQTGTTLRGAGYDTVITTESTFSDHMIHVENQGANVHSLRLDGTGQDSGHGIYIESTRGHFHHLRIEDCFDDGIHAGHSSWIGVLGGKIHHNTIDGNGDHGIYMDYDATDWEIIDNLISNHDGTGEAGIMVDAGSTLISGNHLWGNYYNIRVAPAHTVYRLRVIGNKIADNDFHGLAMIDDYDLRASFITGNEFWANGYSAPYNHSDSIHFNGTIDGAPDMDIYGLVISGNSFFGYKEDVAQDCTRYAINDVNDRMHYSSITGNTFYQLNVQNAVNVDDSDNVDMANAYYDCDGFSGIDVTG
jgi:hypothetical protein